MLKYKCKKCKEGRVDGSNVICSNCVIKLENEIKGKAYAEALKKHIKKFRDVYYGAASLESFTFVMTTTGPVHSARIEGVVKYGK